MNPLRPITEKEFKEWLEKQPWDRIFNYFHPNHCMICEFLRETRNLEEAHIQASGTFVQVDGNGVDGFDNLWELLASAKGGKFTAQEILENWSIYSTTTTMPSRKW